MAKEWANDICGCFSDYKSCIITGCCPCITSYQIGSRLALKIGATLSLVIYAVLLLFDFMVFIANRKTSELETEAWESWDHHDPERSGSFSFPPEYNELMDRSRFWRNAERVFVLLACLALLLICIIVCRFRKATRDKYDLEGDIARDVCYSCCAAECALCQMKFQLDFEDSKMERVAPFNQQEEAANAI